MLNFQLQDACFWQYENIHGLFIFGAYCRRAFMIATEIVYFDSDGTADIYRHLL